MSNEIEKIENEIDNIIIKYEKRINQIKAIKGELFKLMGTLKQRQGSDVEMIMTPSIHATDESMRQLYKMRAHDIIEKVKNNINNI